MLSVMKRRSKSISRRIPRSLRVFSTAPSFVFLCAYFVAACGARKLTSGTRSSRKTAASIGSTVTHSSFSAQEDYSTITNDLIERNPHYIGPSPSPSTDNNNGSGRPRRRRTRTTKRADSSTIVTPSRTKHLEFTETGGSDSESYGGSDSDTDCDSDVDGDTDIDTDNGSDSDTDGESDYDSDDESEAETDIEHDNAVDAENASRNATLLNATKASTVSKKISQISVAVSPKAVAKFCRQNRALLVIAAILFAFRREIFPRIFRYLFSQMSITSVVKILLFLDFMRKLVGFPMGGEPENHLDGTGRSNDGRAFGLFSNKLLHKFDAFNPPVVQHFMFERVSSRYGKDAVAMKKALSTGNQGDTDTAKGGAQLHISNTTNATAVSSNTSAPPSTVVVLEFKADVTAASPVVNFRDAVGFLLSQQCRSSLPGDALEIVLVLESPGGSVADYGLAAELLAWIRKQDNITLTICVDKVAASGGYMMACQASPGKLLAAPFSILGSIGVVSEAINIHNALQSFGIQPLVFKAGAAKAPVGMLGEVTKEGMEKVQGMVEKTHSAFKTFVSNARPSLDVEKVATGEIWLGIDAMKVGLVDRIITSDEYIADRIKRGDMVLRLQKYDRARGFPWAGGKHPFSPFRLSTKAFIRTATDFKRTVATLADLLDGKARVMPEPSVKAMLHTGKSGFYPAAPETQM